MAWRHLNNDDFFVKFQVADSQRFGKYVLLYLFLMPAYFDDKSETLFLSKRRMKKEECTTSVLRFQFLREIFIFPPQYAVP